MIFRLFLVLVVGLASLPSCAAQSVGQGTDTGGPASGRLLLLGGGILDIHADLIKRFAGGADATLIVVPTAYSDEQIEADPDFTKVKNRFSKLGIEHIQILHTRDREEANSEVFTQPIHDHNGVFFLGGNTQRIGEAYLGTKTQQALSELLARGGIIAGASAGSGIQAAYFSEEGLQHGFEWVRGVVVMNHFLARNKQFDHSEELRNLPDRIGLGIDENTGILVQNDRFEVIGNSYVVVYDGKGYSRSPDSMYQLPAGSDRFYVLQNGDRYNLSMREVESNQRLIPVDLPKEELQQYAGTYRDTTTSFSMKLNVSGDGILILSNGWGWDPYPIYPYRKDVFFAVNRTMWFAAVRDPESGAVIGFQKMKSILQRQILADMLRIKE